MIYTEINEYKSARDKILSAVSKLSEPIIGTLTPKGRNVLCQDVSGQTFQSNDGYTLARNITLQDPLENAVAEIIKHGSFKTNAVAGDGTTTTILLSKSLIENGIRLIDNGMNPMDLTKEMGEACDILLEEVSKRAVKSESDQELEFVARVSANNDEEIAKNCLRVIKKAGLDGLVFINDSTKDTVDIEEEDGFVMNQGMFAPELRNLPDKFAAQYENILVFITDKRLYYEDEVVAMLEMAQQQGETQIMIVAADFIGNVPRLLISNHVQNRMNILMVKESNPEILEDMASYLGSRVLMEKNGGLRDQLTPLDIHKAQRVFSDNRRTVVFSDRVTMREKRVEAIRAKIEEVDRDSDEESEYKRRLACLTNGIVTIKVGGKTPPEIRERVYRYEDAINATRNALKEGWVPGGGITLLSAYRAIASKLSGLSQEVQGLMKRYAESPMRQIAANCNKHAETILANATDVVGYNAVTDKMENLVDAGIIEPVIVEKEAIANSFSVAKVILSSGFVLINKEEKDEDKARK